MLLMHKIKLVYTCKYLVIFWYIALAKISVSSERVSERASHSCLSEPLTSLERNGRAAELAAEFRISLVINSFSLQNHVNSNFKIVMHLNHIVYYIKNLTPIRITIFLCKTRISSQNIIVTMFDGCTKSDSEIFASLPTSPHECTQYQHILKNHHSTP